MVCRMLQTSLVSTHMPDPSGDSGCETLIASLLVLFTVDDDCFEYRHAHDDQ